VSSLIPRLSTILANSAYEIAVFRASSTTLAGSVDKSAFLSQAIIRTTPILLESISKDSSIIFNDTYRFSKVVTFRAPPFNGIKSTANVAQAIERCFPFFAVPDFTDGSEWLDRDLLEDDDTPVGLYIEFAPFASGVACPDSTQNDETILKIKSSNQDVWPSGDYAVTFTRSPIIGRSFVFPIGGKSASIVYTTGSRGLQVTVTASDAKDEKQRLRLRNVGPVVSQALNRTSFSLTSSICSELSTFFRTLSESLIVSTSESAASCLEHAKLSTLLNPPLTITFENSTGLYATLLQPDASPTASNEAQSFISPLEVIIQLSRVSASALSNDPDGVIGDYLMGLRPSKSLSDVLCEPDWCKPLLNTYTELGSSISPFQVYSSVVFGVWIAFAVLVLFVGLLGVVMSWVWGVVSVRGALAAEMCGKVNGGVSEGMEGVMWDGKYFIGKGSRFPIPSASRSDRRQGPSQPPVLGPHPDLSPQNLHINAMPKLPKSWTSLSPMARKAVWATSALVIISIIVALSVTLTRNSTTASQQTNTDNNGGSSAPIVGPQVTQRALVIANPSDNYLAAVNLMRGYGMPYDLFNVGSGNFNLEVTPNAVGSYSFVVLMASMNDLSSDQQTRLRTYLSTYNIRLVKLNDLPDPATGVAPYDGSGTDADQPAYLTPDGAQLALAAGVQPSILLSTANLWHMPGRITNSSIAKPILMFERNAAYPVDTVAAAILTYPTHQQLSFYVPSGSWSLTSMVLGHIWFSWATRGFYPGFRRIVFSAH
ncbi:hypothetical protein HDV05_008349, partial [Chytridiales sp. JEL 0842]